MNWRLEVLRSCRLGLNRHRTREEVERAGCGTDLAGGDAKIPSSRRQATVAEQQLNGADICAGFEEMNRKSVPESMGRDRLAVARKLASFLTGKFNGASVNRRAGNIALEQPIFRPCNLPVVRSVSSNLGDSMT